MNDSVKLIKASTHQPQVITCCITDQLFSQYSVPVLFCFNSAFAPSQLLASLQAVLSDFPVFCGRLRSKKNNLFIDCNNEGTLFSTVNSDDTLWQVMRQLPNITKSRLVEPIDPKKTIADSSAVMTIKLTYFACGGMAMGLCWHHAIGDMDTFMSFMRAWSSVTVGGDYERPLIVENRADYLQKMLPDNGSDVSGFRRLGNAELIKLSAQIVLKAKEKTSVRIYFSQDELTNMKRSLSMQADRQLSTNDALCAHLFSQLSALDSPEKAGYLSIVVGHRARTALPHNLLGNFYSILHTPTPAQIDSAQLATDVRDSVDDFERSHLDYYANKRFVENNGGPTKLNRFIVKSIDLKKRALLITNWSGFNVHDLTFGSTNDETSKGAELRYFTPFGEAPLPWLSSLVKGVDNQGLVYSAVLPKKLAQQISDRDSLAKIHSYRDCHETLPNLIKDLAWLL